MIRCYRAPRLFGSPKARLPPLSSLPCIGQTPVMTCRHYHSGPATSPVSSVAGVLAPPQGAPQTYLDFMERLWNSKWFGTVDGSAAAVAKAHIASADPSLFTQMFLSCQQALGMEAGTLLLLAGALTRLCTLFFSLYGERAGERMRLALPELKKPQEDFNRVYFNDLASAMEVQIAASVLKSHRRAVFGKYHTSNLKCIASVGMAPVIMTGLYQVSALCENASLDVGTSSYLWCTALTLPDPFAVLPTLTCVITLLNFELSLSKEIKTGWMRNVIWGARLGCLCVIPVLSSFRSGVCLYLVGMNAVGLLQPLLLRSAVIRRWLGFPSAEEIAAVTPRRSATVPQTAVSGRAATLRERIVAAVAPAEKPAAAGVTVKASDAAADVLKTSMTAQFPYLSHLLNPQVDEYQDLFAKAPTKQSKPDFSGRGRGASSSNRLQGQQCTAFAYSGAAPAHGSRYARGANPLMQETPLHRQAPSSSHASPHESGGAGDSSGDAAPAGETSSAASIAAAKRPPKPKGSVFASSGWKSTQLSFSEADFIPTYSSGTPSHPSSPSSQPHK
ncbi:conserved hypothetical protein [Leishmania infantum JPCM5]|uniref:60Kd_inner_membrane_protein_-_putative n=2 Tax=Leishmania infantum TaxID=5671 RepID=A0A6L0XSI8_LEIIN|nr:conserved hypothetical protein [Leishmania infantum JPCM5]CAC9547019.1 60Kd_inner_membrane_protein_-_putative [Leishmania infantum]CAM72370.1 conserved hypothetical protein [Leishmania infantum JPCM5]SUZ46289.1 60Kd_inner_membrane_protein_-_putative [Leishmania infantum]|eukprot:XP_001469267.1 conserved hypothetical protein [Leishmania infantum JPCM5]